MLLTGIYDYYKQHNPANESIWSFFKEIEKNDAQIWKILLNVSIFAAGIAFLAAVILLAVTAGGGRGAKEFQEAKRWLLRLIVISVLTFAVTGIITMVGTAGLG